MGPCFSCCSVSLLALVPFASWMIYTIALCWGDSVIIAHPYAAVQLHGSVSRVARVGAATVVCLCRVYRGDRCCLYRPIMAKFLCGLLPNVWLTCLLSMQLRIRSYQLMGYPIWFHAYLKFRRWKSTLSWLLEARREKALADSENWPLCDQMHYWAEGWRRSWTARTTTPCGDVCLHELPWSSVEKDIEDVRTLSPPPSFPFPYPNSWATPMPPRQAKFLARTLRIV